MKSIDLLLATAARLSAGILFTFALSLLFVLPVSADESFAGTWQSKRSALPGAPNPFAGDFDLQLSQIGKVVSGTYANGGGTITGIVSSGMLKFNFQDDFGVGTGTFHISKDGRNLIGRYTGRTARLRSITGTWNATRLGQAKMTPPTAEEETPAPVIKPKSIGKNKHFMGRWTTTTSQGGSFEIYFTWNGLERVTGTFTGGGSTGTITGSVFENKVLLFNWTQDGGKYRGSGRFVLSDDGQSFTGTYSNNLQNPNDGSAGSWNGFRKK